MRVLLPFVGSPLNPLNLALLALRGTTSLEIQLEQNLLRSVCCIVISQV